MTLAGADIWKGMFALSNPLGKGYAAHIHMTETAAMHQYTIQINMGPKMKEKNKHNLHLLTKELPCLNPSVDLQ